MAGAFSLVVVLAVTFVGGSEGAESADRPPPSALELAPAAQATCGEHTFANLNATTINNEGIALPYPSYINVSGVLGTVQRVRVTLNNFTHYYPRDVDVLLKAPSGRKVFSCRTWATIPTPLS